ncbi:Spermidine/putrescine import ATP-binding protein PotA [compost metagenome]
MRAELRRIQRELGITMLYVTHDQEEALALSDRIVVMNGGRIEQLAAPEVVFNTPSTRFVANFMGFENLFDYRDGALHHAGASLPYTSPVAAGTTVLGWRPDKVRVCAADDVAGQYPGTVLARGFLGDTVEYLLQTPLGQVKGICAAGGAAWREGTAVSFVLPADSALWLAA